MDRIAIVVDQYTDSYGLCVDIVILHNFAFNEILCKHNGIPLGAHFTYWNSVTYWPEDGLK